MHRPGKGGLWRCLGRLVCINTYGSDYKVKKKLDSKELFKIDNGVYSTEPEPSELELICFKYPDAIFTMDSAFYYLGLTDVIPDFYCLAPKRNYTRIHNPLIKQFFSLDNIFLLGRDVVNYQGHDINIYNQERMLIELIRNKNKLPFDFYKEIIGNYRQRIGSVNFSLIDNYLQSFQLFFL